jgi:hypothetical protein
VPAATAVAVLGVGLSAGVTVAVTTFELGAVLFFLVLGACLATWPVKRGLRHVAGNPTPAGSLGGARRAYPRSMKQQVILDMNVGAGEHFPALRARRPGSGEEQTQRARSLLWQAFQLGDLTVMQFRQTLNRLEPAAPEPQKSPRRRH